MQHPDIGCTELDCIKLLFGVKLAEQLEFRGLVHVILQIQYWSLWPQSDGARVELGSGASFLVHAALRLYCSAVGTFAGWCLPWMCCSMGCLSVLWNVCVCLPGFLLRCRPYIVLSVCKSLRNSQCGMVWVAEYENELFDWDELLQKSR